MSLPMQQHHPMTMSTTANGREILLPIRISIDAAIKLVPDGMRLYSLGYYPGADGGGWLRWRR